MPQGATGMILASTFPAPALQPTEPTWLVDEALTGSHALADKCHAPLAHPAAWPQDGHQDGRRWLVAPYGPVSWVHKRARRRAGHPATRTRHAPLCDPRGWTRGAVGERTKTRGPSMTTRQLPGFERATFTHQERTHPVYRAGAGPAVIVIHELPGIHPGVVTFAQRLVDAGYTVYLPSLFGRPGEPLAVGATLRSVLRVCVAREFTILADRTSPVATWLRALAAKAHGECGGPGVGAVGMRFTDDRGCPGERFQTLRRELGEGFEGIEIDSSPGNPHGIPSRAHAVLTVDLVDRPGH